MGFCVLSFICFGGFFCEGLIYMYIQINPTTFPGREQDRYNFG